MNHLCKTIIMENKKFHEELKSAFYHKYVCVVVQYTTSLNNQKIINVMKNHHNSNRKQPTLSNKYFHYRIANEEDAFRLSGYEHNAFAPFCFNERRVK